MSRDYNVKVVSAIVSVALYLLLFQAVPSFGTVAQPAGIAVLAGAAFVAFFTIRTTRQPLTRVEFALLAIALMSGVASVIASNLYSAGFSALFGLAVLSIAILTRSLDTDTLLRAAANAFAAMALTILVVHFSELRVSLNDNSANRYSLRLKPFGLHSNLTGFIFGGGTILSIYAAIVSRRVTRVVFLFTAVLSPLIVLAASHRSTVVALSSSAVILGAAFAHRIRGRTRRYAIAAAAFILSLTAVFADRVVRYLWTVLEFDSKYRGVGSGATGRTEVWAGTFELAFQDRLTVFTGLALRGADFEDIGWSTENSYITILLESGLIIGGLYILLMLRSSLVSAVRAWQAPQSQIVVHLAIAWLILDALIGSFFNRYLLAIGNPMSILILIVVMKSALLENGARRPVAAATTATPTLRRVRRVVRNEPRSLAPAE